MTDHIDRRRAAMRASIFTACVAGAFAVADATAAREASGNPAADMAWFSFDHMDQNHDGQVTAAEWAAWQGEKSADARFAAIDARNRGYITFAEYWADISGRYDTAVLTREGELQTWPKR